MEVHVLTARTGRCDSAVLKTTRFKINAKISSINSPYSTSHKTKFLSGKIEMAYSKDWPFSFSLPRVRLLISSDRGIMKSWCTDFPSWELIFFQPTSGYSSGQSPLLAALCVCKGKPEFPLLETSWDAYPYESRLLYKDQGLWWLSLLKEL